MHIHGLKDTNTRTHGCGIQTHITKTLGYITHIQGSGDTKTHIQGLRDTKTHIQGLIDADTHVQGLENTNMWQWPWDTNIYINDLGDKQTYPRLGI